VASGGDGDLQLGADAVIGSDQQGVAVTGGLEIEKPAEPPETGIGAAAGRRAGERLDRFDQGVAGIDIDPGFLVTQRLVGRFPASYGVLRSHGVFRAGTVE
jgi:hypothetical protein